MGTLRVYCSETNCQFGITLRVDPEQTGNHWLLGETYDPIKMCHSHSLKPSKAIEKKVIDEEMIESDADSYGDQEFDDRDPVVLADGQNDIDLL